MRLAESPETIHLLDMKRTYLDWASAAPVSKGALKAFERAVLTDGNPSAPHTEGRTAKELLESARLTIARLASVKPDSIIFTSGATEANNLALHGVRGHVLYLPTAHASVIEPLEAGEAEIEALVLKDGAIDLQALKKQIRPETVLVVMDAVCGETGTRFDTRGVRRTLDEVRPGIRLHVDASQLPLTESFELTRLAADTVTLDAQKVRGVRGIGALIVRHGVSITPLMFGGGQEQGLRPGTEMPALAAAFAQALTETQKQAEAFSKRAEKDRTVLIETIRTVIPDMEVNVGKEHVPHILNLSFPNRDTDYAIALLDEAGFAVSTKSACETDAEGSRVVLALTGDAVRAASTLRISWGSTTLSKDLVRFASALIHTIRFLDAHPL